MSFIDQIVLITGAAGGIGKEAANVFANEGATLALVDLYQSDLEKVVQELNLQKHKYLLLPADVTKEEQVEKFVQKTKASFGKIDVFFNNAGIEGKVAPITDYPSDIFETVMNVNVMGVFYGLKHVLRVMKEQKYGSVINTSSIGGLRGFPGTSAYIASKFAIIGLTKTAALESAGDGIRVNAICPAPINTRMMRDLEKGMAPENPDAAIERFLSIIPMGRYGEPQEVAKAVRFLASKEASFITGTALEVDGGLLA